MKKAIGRVFTLLLVAAIAYGGYTIWTQARYAPSVDEVIQAVTASLREQVPGAIISFPAGYREQDGHQALVDSIAVNKIGRKNVDETGRDYWLVDVSVEGTCLIPGDTTRQGSSVYGHERDRYRFAGKVWYRMYPAAAEGRQLLVDQETWRAVPEHAAPFGIGRPRVY